MSPPTLPRKRSNGAGGGGVTHLLRGARRREGYLLIWTTWKYLMYVRQNFVASAFSFVAHQKICHRGLG